MPQSTATSVVAIHHQQDVLFFYPVELVGYLLSCYAWATGSGISKRQKYLGHKHFFQIMVVQCGILALLLRSSIIIVLSD
mmetsp:Transcript_23714/g.35634  ORF Transcript_23714/g.35634 Transcript_23714/m.35634 type:complete len:80 (-) Transcript_23714:205-444(-)